MFRHPDWMERKAHPGATIFLPVPAQEVPHSKEIRGQRQASENPRLMTVPAGTAHVWVPKKGSEILFFPSLTINRRQGCEWLWPVRSSELGVHLEARRPRLTPVLGQRKGKVTGATGRMVGAEAGRGWEQVDAGRRTQAFSYKMNELRRLMYSMRSVVNNLYWILEMW